MQNNLRANWKPGDLESMIQEHPTTDIPPAVMQRKPALSSASLKSGCLDFDQEISPQWRIVGSPQPNTDGMGPQPAAVHTSGGSRKTVSAHLSNEVQVVKAMEVGNQLLTD